jgi:hypothetical protein
MRETIEERREQNPRLDDAMRPRFGFPFNFFGGGGFPF